MGDDIENFQAKLSKVRERFRAGLKEKLPQMRALGEKLINEKLFVEEPPVEATPEQSFDMNAARKLRQLAHSLAGYPIGVAHPEMNRRATLLETILQSILQNAPDDDEEEEASETERVNPAEYIPEIHDLVLSIERYAAMPVEPEYEFSPPVLEHDARSLYLVDDDQEFATNLADQLDHFGYETTIFSHPDQMERSLAQGTRPAAILMDIVFFEDTEAGLKSAKRLRRGKIAGVESIPLIFLSARDDLQARLEAIRAKGRAYITKPLYVTALIDKLDELLDVVSEDPLRVLIVEDDAVLAAYYSLILEQANLKTHILKIPDQIFDALIDFRPDLIVMDQYLDNDYLGSDLAQAIAQHEQFFDVPVVFLSTETSIEIHFDILAAGGDIFLSKPVRPDHLISVVTTKAERSRKLHALAIRDSLTGLLNHAAAKEELVGLTAQARRLKKTVSVAMLDLDYFKSVNDTHGHATGDRVLLAIARILKQRLRKSDIIARYGGEEFMVVLPYTPASAAAQVMDEIREHFSSVELAGQGPRRFHASFSCGVADLEQVPDAPELIDAADRALYAAKKAGRNQVALYDPATDQIPLSPEQKPDGESTGRPAGLRGEDRRHPDAMIIGATGHGDAANSVDRLKDEFISAVSHELRTPLTGLRGAVGLLLGGAAGELPERARELLLMAESQGGRLSRLVHDLLDMESMESGRIRYRFEACDLAHLVRAAVREAHVFAQASSVSVEIAESPDELELPRLDPVRIRKLLDNLLHNAVKFSPTDGTVTVRLTRFQIRNEARVRFAVTDQGPGIPEDFRDEVFNKFSQADGSASRSLGGIGLGLTMCRAIVRRHGGTISFESDPERGTTFFFELKDAHQPAGSP
ncbi:MAG: diguanylate cyclase [bacterium]|nr:diguanylate cyclase [bacterium]